MPRYFKFFLDQMLRTQGETLVQGLALQPKAKSYKISIGNGAYLLVMPNGQKYWRLKYRLRGKECTYGLGVFPRVSIIAALVARDSVKAVIQKGINPVVARREATRTAAICEPLFLLALSKTGALTIETETDVLTLTFPQTQALAKFLAASDQHKMESKNAPHGRKD